MQARAIAIVLALGALAPAAAFAQGLEVEEQAADGGDGYVQGVGRGFVYGAALSSPLYLTPIERGGGSREALGVGPGGGLQARLGWELPDGFTIELYGGFAFNLLDAVPGEAADRSHSLGEGSVSLGLRYDILFDPVFVPFVRVGAGARLLFFSWGSGADASGDPLPTVNAAVGAHFALSPYFGIELGALVDYTFGVTSYEAGFLSITPFLGVALYLYDENDPVF